jgi:hypothetical protein
LLVIPVAVVIFSLYGFSAATLTWSISLTLEALIVLAFALFAGLTFERATTTAFVTLSFYFFARLIGFFLGIRQATPSAGTNQIINPMIDALGLVVPRLDLLAQTNWLVYGFDATAIMPFVLLQSAIFICLALAATAIDFHRKQF